MPTVTRPRLKTVIPRPYPATVERRPCSKADPGAKSHMPLDDLTGEWRYGPNLTASGMDRVPSLPHVNLAAAERLRAPALPFTNGKKRFDSMTPPSSVAAIPDAATSLASIQEDKPT